MKPKNPRGKIKAGPDDDQSPVMEVMRNKEYREDPAIHSQDADPHAVKPPKDMEKPDTEEDEESEKNRVLTSPIPLVVSAPEAIEKMEGLNELIKEGRPDLSKEADAVEVALDALERKAMGETGDEPGGMAPDGGEAPVDETAAEYVVGDRVVLALDDGEYQGEIQAINDDGTFDIKTDQMATFRRVPAESIGRPEMLSPIAPRASKSKPTGRTTVKKIVKAKSKAKVNGNKFKAGRKIKAEMKEGYTETGVKVLEDQGKPRSFDPDADDAVPAELYVNAEGKLALVNPDGETYYEDEANDDVEFSYWKTAHTLIPTTAQNPQNPDNPAPSQNPANPSNPSAPEPAMAASRKVKARSAMETGFAAEKVAKEVFSMDPQFVTGLIGTGLSKTLAQDLEGKFVDFDLPEGITWDDVASSMNRSHMAEGITKSYESEEAQALANEQLDASQKVKANLSKGDKLRHGDDPKEYVVSKVNSDEFWVEGEEESYVLDNVGLEGHGNAWTIVAAKTPAGDLMETHKIKSDEFYMVRSGKPVLKMNRASLDQSITAGLLVTDGVQGLFEDKGAANRFAKIVGGKVLAEEENKHLSQEEVDQWLTDNGYTTEDLGENYPSASEISQVADGNGLSFMEALDQLSSDAYELTKKGVEATKDPQVSASEKDIKIELSKAKGDLEEASYLAEYSESNLGKSPSKAKNLAEQAKSMGESGSRSAGNAAKAIKGTHTLIAKGRVSELRKDETYAVAIDAAKLLPYRTAVIYASKDGVITAGDAEDAKISMMLVEEAAEDVRSNAKSAVKKIENKKPGGAVKNAEEAGKIAKDVIVPSAKRAEVELAASAFDEIEDLDIGGGMTARRKKGSDKEDGEGLDEIEVVDKGGKVVSTYPDAFGDDTVMIIKFLRQVLDITDKDDKKNSEPANIDTDDDAEDKPKTLPNVKDKDKKDAKDKDDEELKARATLMEARLEDCRFVVKAMLQKGHIQADQAEIDAELLKGTPLRQAQVVAAGKSVDREVMRLLAKPETELQIIKASLPHLAVRSVKVQASVGGIDGLVNLSAGGLIHASAKRGSNVGLAISTIGKH